MPAPLDLAIVSAAVALCAGWLLRGIFTKEKSARCGACPGGGRGPCGAGKDGK